MIMTGTSLQDFPRTIVGYDMWERAANPKGAANVSRIAHWKYALMSDFVRFVSGRGCFE